MKPIATGGSTSGNCTIPSSKVLPRKPRASNSAVAQAKGSAAATATEEIFRLSSNASTSSGARRNMEPPARFIRGRRAQNKTAAHRAAVSIDFRCRSVARVKRPEMSHHRRLVVGIGRLDLIQRLLCLGLLTGADQPHAQTDLGIVLVIDALGDTRLDV